MKYGKLTLGQIEALINKLGGEDTMRGILDGTVEFAVMTQAREFLRPAGEFTLPAATELFDPTAYFQTCEGLYVGDWFKNRILRYVHEVDSSPEVTLFAFDLAKSANDAEIHKELPEDHVFEDASEFCAILAQMIDRQPDGEEGNLLSGGHWSIFYVQAGGEVHAVHVYWDDAYRKWYVFASLLDDVRWREGYQVVSATV